MIQTFRSDARLFRERVEAEIKPAFEAAAKDLLAEADRGLGFLERQGEPSGKAGILGRLGALRDPLETVTEVAVPVAGIGAGLFLIFGYAITTTASFLFAPATSVNRLLLLVGIAAVAVWSYRLLSAPRRRLQKKRSRILRRYDSFIRSEIAPDDAKAYPNALAPRLIEAIRRRAEEAEARLSDA